MGTHLIMTGALLLLVASRAARASSEPRRPESAPPRRPRRRSPTRPRRTMPSRKAVRRMADKPFAGDLDAMVKRRAIRVAVTFNRTHYFIDRGQERGLTYEAVKSFENGSEHGAEDRQPQGPCRDRPDVARPAVPGPVKRQGRHGGGHGDRQARAREARGLLGADAHQRKSGGRHRARCAADRHRGRPGRPARCSFARLSPYYESLTRLNEQLNARGKPAVVIDEAPDVLEDDDVLEMVNAGLAPITIVDDYLAEFWKQVFTNLDGAQRRRGALRRRAGRRVPQGQPQAA